MAEGSAGTSLGAATGGARILIVDDNKVNRLLLARNLELQGTESSPPRTAASRSDACGEKLRSPAARHRDARDGRLPGAGADPRRLQLRDLPVIVTSSLEGLDNVVRCIELGAEDYLPKPINPVLLKARIGASLEKKRLRDQQKALVRRFASARGRTGLGASGFALGGRRVRASVMFSDIRGFTALAESQPPEETIELLNTYYTLMFDVIGGHGGIVSHIAGDGLMAIFGAPLPLPDHCDAAVRSALEMLELVRLFNAEQAAAGKPQIRIGIGIASGEMVAGYAGTNERATYTCIGDTVNLASRLEAHTKLAARAILIDGSTRDGLRGLEVEALVRLRYRAGRSRSMSSPRNWGQSRNVRAPRARSSAHPHLGRLSRSDAGVAASASARTPTRPIAYRPCGSRFDARFEGIGAKSELMDDGAADVIQFAFDSRLGTPARVGRPGGSAKLVEN